MSTTLERSVEQVFLELLCSEPQLAALKPGPRDRDVERKALQLVVEAKTGNRREDGPKAYEVAVKVELRANFKDTVSRSLDQLWRLVENAIAAMQGATAETLALFQYFLPLPDAQSDRESEGDSRIRSREYPIMALLA